MEILYEDREILVCYKEPGLAAESARLGQKDLAGWLRTWLREQNPQKGVPYLGLVHRLDQPVQGIVLTAKTREAAAALSAQLQSSRMRKTYRAIVTAPSGGWPPEGAVEEWTLVEDLLLRDGRTNTSAVVPPGTAGAKRASLSFRVLDQGRMGGAQLMLLEIRLHTGRHHQIRVQLAHAGLPILGDQKYAGIPQPGHHPEISAKQQSSVSGGEKVWPALCAFRLSFAHPKTGKTMTFSLPEEDYCLEHFRYIALPDDN